MAKRKLTYDPATRKVNFKAANNQESDFTEEFAEFLQTVQNKTIRIRSGETGKGFEMTVKGTI